MKTVPTLLAAAILAGLGTFAPPAALAAPADTAEDAPLSVEWDARVRHEQVDDDAFARDARADTLRLRLGLRANFSAGWSGFVEGVGVAAAGSHYNSGANGHVQYPAITDPKGGDLNQAYLRWSGATFGASVGRQRLGYDNQRWIGPSAWRQFEQTFDAAAFDWKATDALTLHYAWLDRVHRVAGPDALNHLARARALNTHLLNAALAQGTQQWSAYAYLHKDEDVASASSATYGLRWSGSALREGNGFLWAAEAARQQDYANNPLDFSHRYWLLEPGWTQSGVTAKLGWEHLGGNGTHALQTPLGSLHPFNGWNDQFGVIPNGGLEDRYASVAGKFGRSGLGAKLGWTLAWHDYRADRGGRYGSEWNAALGFPVAFGIKGQVALANYRADGLGRDNAKVFLQLEWAGKQAL